MEREEKLGETSEQPREAVGKKLKAAREKAGLSIQDVAERTRVPARHLSAVEEGRFQDLPALAYSAGFARSFAQAIGLDGSEIAAQYRAEANPDPLPYYDQYEPLDEARVPSSSFAWIAAAVGALIVALLIAFSMGIFSRDGDNVATVAVTSEPARVPPAEESSEPPAATPASPEQAASEPATGPAPAASAGSKVVLTASEDAWIKVYDRGGQTVRMGILSAGESYAVPGDPNQLLLWTGKAGAVRVKVDGTQIAPLGKSVQTVRDVSLAPASLLARSAAGTAPGAR